MIMPLVLLAVGLLGLWFGAERVVSSGKILAQRLGMSQLLVGLTIVSIGTSLPEIMVSLFSGLNGQADIAVGSMTGSCLAQITLILGIAGLIQNLHVREKAVRVDGMMLLIAIALFAFFLATGLRLERWEAILLMTLYIGYLVYSIRYEQLRFQAMDRIFHLVVHNPPKKLPLPVRLLEMAVGVAIVAFSGHLVLENAVLIAQSSGLSDTFIGVMIVGVATGLPELSTAVVGYLKKAQGLSVGSLIGSNITDPMFSVSVGALVAGFDTDPSLLFFDIPFWFIATAIALLLLYDRQLSLSKQESLVLILIYGIFVITKIGAI